MAESSMNLRMAETNNTAMKEALCAQQRLLQKLYNELDEEREASSSAASEALSMILRLQGEKAAVKMEAEQYKRLAEEKMLHAEESMAIFEDLIYQKEMEIASLDYQVQAYRYKLLSLGYNDPGVGETKFPENLLQRTETLAGETSAQSSSIGRRNSAPSKFLKLSHLKRGAFEKERSSSPESEMIVKMLVESGHVDEDDQNSDSEKKTDHSSSAVDINSYWEQIRKLDERVKEMAGEQYANLQFRSRSPSVFSQMSSDTKKEGIANEADQGQHSENELENEMVYCSACSLSVHDVFEVPQKDERQTKDEGKMVLQSDESVKKFDTYPLEVIKSLAKDESNFGKTVHSKLIKPSDGTAVNCHLAIVPPYPAVAEAQAKFQQMNWSTEIVELERHDLRQEPTVREEEQLKLLKEIREQLNSIQSELRSCKVKKLYPQHDFGMLSLKEAMLHFWL